MTTTLRIRLFGGVRLYRDEAAELRLAPGLKTLLAFLLLNRDRSHGRDALAAVLWPDAPGDRARRSLNTAIWRLRAVLEDGGRPRGTYLITEPGGDVRFNADSDFWLDSAVFESRVTAALTVAAEDLEAAERERLREVLQLYVGDAMDGCYDDWAVRERDRLERQYLRGLEHLMRAHHHAGECEAAVTCGQRILARDPLREDVHREVMRLFGDQGRRSLVARQYAALAGDLDRELGLLPAAETQTLYSALLAAPVTDQRHDADPPAIDLAVSQLLAVLGRARGVQQELEAAVRVVERAVGHEPGALAAASSGPGGNGRGGLPRR